jgi:hypothetical protein
MWNLFVLKNFGFAVNLLASLAFFAGAWLHLDSMANRKSLPTALRWIGFFLLSLAFLITPLNTGGPELIIRSMGYLTLIISLLTDPLISTPLNIFFAGSFTITYFFPPVAALLCALLFLRKATVGLEKHLTPLAVTFFLLTIAESLSALTHFPHSANPTIFALLSQYGPVWIATQGAFFITTLYFVHWVFRYLLKRFQSQIFFILATSVVIIFLATTFIFTAVLTQNIKRESLSRLESNGQTLALALNYQKTSIQSLAILLSQKSDLVTALSESDYTRLSPILNSAFLEQKIDSLIIASTSGRILFQAEDPDKVGGSLSSLPLFQKALSGQTSTSIVKIESPLVPQLAIVSSVPIVNPTKQILGVLMIDQILDQTCIDELHPKTASRESVSPKRLPPASPVPPLPTMPSSPEF